MKKSSPPRSANNEIINQLAPAVTGQENTEENNPAWWANQTNDSIHLIPSGDSEADTARATISATINEKPVNIQSQFEDTVTRSATNDQIPATLSVALSSGDNIPWCQPRRKHRAPPRHRPGKSKHSSGGRNLNRKRGR